MFHKVIPMISGQVHFPECCTNDRRLSYCFSDSSQWSAVKSMSQSAAPWPINVDNTVLWLPYARHHHCHPKILKLENKKKCQWMISAINFNEYLIKMKIVHRLVRFGSSFGEVWYIVWFLIFHRFGTFNLQSFGSWSSIVWYRPSFGIVVRFGSWFGTWLSIVWNRPSEDTPPPPLQSKDIESVWLIKIIKMSVNDQSY